MTAPPLAQYIGALDPEAIDGHISTPRRLPLAWSDLPASRAGTWRGDYRVDTLATLVEADLVDIERTYQEFLRADAQRSVRLGSCQRVETQTLVRVSSKEYIDAR